MATAPITPLVNVPVTDADLIKVRPNIVANYLFDGQANFSEVILEAKRKVHSQLQKSEGLTNTRMASVKDTGLGQLKSRIVHEALAAIFLANGMLDEHDTYKRQAKAIEFDYIIDSDGDDVEDEGERDTASPVRMGR